MIRHTARSRQAMPPTGSCAERVHDEGGDHIREETARLIPGREGGVGLPAEHLGQTGEQGISEAMRSAVVIVPRCSTMSFAATHNCVGLVSNGTNRSTVCTIHSALASACRVPGGRLSAIARYRSDRLRPAARQVAATLEICTGVTEHSARVAAPSQLLRRRGLHRGVPRSRAGGTSRTQRASSAGGAFEPQIRTAGAADAGDDRSHELFGNAEPSPSIGDERFASVRHRSRRCAHPRNRWFAVEPGDVELVRRGEAHLDAEAVGVPDTRLTHDRRAERTCRATAGTRPSAGWLHATPPAQRLGEH